MGLKNFTLLLLVGYLSVISTLLVVSRIGRFFPLEFLALVLFMLFGLIALGRIIHDRAKGYALALILFSIMLLNGVFLQLRFNVGDVFSVVMLFGSLCGCVLSLSMMPRQELVRREFAAAPLIEDIPNASEIPKAVPEVYDIVNESDTKAEEPKQKKRASVKKATANKKPKAKKKTVKNIVQKAFVASSSGSKYHVKSCDWAKKINRKNLVSLNGKAEAGKKGYKPCNCIK